MSEKKVHLDYGDGRPICGTDAFMPEVTQCKEKVTCKHCKRWIQQENEAADKRERSKR
jgi:hypothetical protein